eukprot:TRINITY_DN39358_c0_g1_i1.p2 TRINITY_DN39358_c0_g1~~TRINITY_DN39358_c0_g1_i1.p2  ORF type:complete len:158 (+),score=80.79 TRINITY_DN39358_c0_g1_i1:66-539(+)
MSGDEASDAGADFFYVCKKALESVRAKLKKGEDIGKDLVEELAFPDNIGDDELMVPVDMSGAGGDYEDAEDMIEKLGPKGAAEAFVKAADHFDKATYKGERPEPMTAGEWKEVLNADGPEGFEEELLEGEEEELLEDAEEEDEGAGDEPASKKAKTS